MASGPTVGEGSEGEGVREKKRFVESKVYTRKAFKGPRKINNNSTNLIIDLAATTTTSAIEGEHDNNSDRVKESNAAPTTATAIEGKHNNHSEQVKESNTATATPTEATSVIEGKDDNNGNQDKESNSAPTITTTNINGKTNQDKDDNSAQCLPAVVATDDRDLTQQQQQQLISRFDTISDDSPCLNHQQIAVGAAVQSTRDQPSGNGIVEITAQNQACSNLDSRSKQEVQEIRLKLESQLEMVRNMLKKIEAKQEHLSVTSNFHGSANEGRTKSGGEIRMHSVVAPVRTPRDPPRPLNQLSISVLENSQGVNDYVEKEKRTPKANQFYRKSEFLLGKDKLPPAESNKKSKLNVKKPVGGLTIPGFGQGSKFFKSCSSLLDKLIKHKFGWVFDAPVDVEGLGLHDYYTIIKHPMDLGTVKSRLNKNWYKSPKEFAEDVRLTFHNAMTYNPQGQDVHVMAEQLLATFEDRWVIIESDYNREMRFGTGYGATLSTPTSRKAHLPRPPPLDVRPMLERSESTTYRLDSKNKPLSSTPSARTPAPKKPKAKDPHKRDMTYEEKQKLSSNLQNLPSEKLDAIVQIIKKRNTELFQHDEEIEVDIDSVDAETLWELDRFVTNYKKSLSKNKRKAELALRLRADGAHDVPQKIQSPVVIEVSRENKADENIVSSSVPVQGQGNSRSRSSSSSSSSSDSGSSSSDSDSESSSASESDTGS